MLPCKGEKIIFKCNFESPKDFKSWKGWGTSPQKIELVKKNTGGNALQFTGKGWNTGMIDIKPPFVVTATTVLRFNIKSSRAGSITINIKNGSEGAEYAMPFKVNEPNKWTNIQLALKDAEYKRYGKPNVDNDGMIGDELTRIQIAFAGKQFLIDDFEIINLLESDIKELSVVPKCIPEYLNNYQKQNYSQISRNGIFPFGAIITLRGENSNVKFFGQTLLERYKTALLEMKQRGFNTISNFCNGFSTELTLKLMQKYHLYLLHTATCGRTIYALPEKHKLIKAIKEFSHHPNLLAWYGQDEPTDIDVYLKNKKRVETLSSGGAPYASAMHMNYVIKTVGPCMEVIMIDPYSINGKFDPLASSSTLSKHSVNVNIAREASMGKRVWMIPQAFSLRVNGKTAKRYPRPVEVRFDVFNALAMGASGFIFFIYNDTVPYFDKAIRGEEFDQTLVDAWGNGNATYDTLSEIGRRLIPIMPSFLNIKKSKKLKINCFNSKIIVRQWKNELGTLVFCVNSDLTKKVTQKIKFFLPKKKRVYNLDTLTPFKGASLYLNIKPGDGQLFLITSKKKFAKAALEINFRKSIARWELMDVKLKILKRAGFDTSKISQELAKIKPDKKGTPKIIPANILNELYKEISDLRKSNSRYCNIADGLKSAKKAFGRINAALVAPGVIEKIDKNPQWYNIFDAIKEAGKLYFTMQLDWNNGKFDIPQKKLPELEAALAKLGKQISTKLRENKIKPLW